LIPKEKTGGRRVLPWGAVLFNERIKKAMGAMAKGRSIQPAEGSFELRKTQSDHNSIFEPNNRDIGPK
jgi:hypothetical protein